MKINKPKDLMSLFFKYRLKELPVVKEGAVVGKICKPDLIKKLRKIEHFDSDVVNLIDEIFDPVDSEFLDELKKRLLDGEIRGVPLLSPGGEVKRVITPGFLETEEETEKFLDETRRRSIYEEMISQFPFPVCLKKNQELVFSNETYRCMDISGWEELEFPGAEYRLLIYLPEAVFNLFSSFKNLQSGSRAVCLRELLEEIEFDLLTAARRSGETVSEAARMVNLPRQTFNYRWEKVNDEKEETKGED